MTTDAGVLPDSAAELVPAIDPPSEAAREAARERQQRLAKPPGSLGTLEQLSIWLAGVSGACPPPALQRVRVVVFAGDHGITRAGVSAYPAEITPAMVRLVCAGGAAVNALARAADVGVRVLDLGVDADLSDLPADVVRHKVRRGSGSIDREDALTEAETVQAYETGRRVADEEADAGVDLLCLGDLGIGNTTVAAALLGAVLGVDAASVVGRGTGVDDAGWMRKCAAVRDALRRARAAAGPLELLQRIGSADFAAVVGFLVQSAARRTPVVLDGVISGACAVVAAQLAPQARPWWVAGHRSAEPAHALALRSLGLTPVLDYGMRLGEGTGAVLAVPILRAAQATLAEMATLDEVVAAPPPAAVR